MNTDSKQEAPERVFLKACHPASPNHNCSWGVSKTQEDSVEYVRADLASRASIAAVEGNDDDNLSVSVDEAVAFIVQQDRAAASSPSPASPVQPTGDQCDAFQPSILGVPELEDRCVKVRGHEGKHSRHAFHDLLPLSPVRIAPGEYEVKARDGRRLWYMDGAALSDWICASVNGYDAAVNAITIATRKCERCNGMGEVEG